MNIQTASAPRTSTIHSSCGKTFAKNENSLRSDSSVFAHSTSFVHEEVLCLCRLFELFKQFHFTQSFASAYYSNVLRLPAPYHPRSFRSDIQADLLPNGAARTPREVQYKHNLSHERCSAIVIKRSSIVRSKLTFARSLVLALSTAFRILSSPS